MSRKTLLAVIGVVGAVITFLQVQFGLSISASAVTSALAATVLYVLFEAKLDIQLMKSQPGKWADPKFWLAFLSTVLVAVAEGFGLNIPVEAIVSVLTVIMTILFGVKFSQPEPY